MSKGNFVKITLKKIKTMNPCRDLLANFEKHYPKFSGTLEDFLSLENITYSDKIWVCTKLMTQNQKFYWARSCAYSVLEIFEAKIPNDDRVRVLLNYLNTLDDVTNLTQDQVSHLNELRDAAVAAYASAAAAADAADAAAADAAAYTAYAAYAAADAAAYAAAYSADAAAYAAADAKKEQQEFQLIILAHIMKMEI